MPAPTSLATNNSNYNELSKRDKKDLTLSSEGSTLKAKEKNRIKGLTLKDTPEINKYELRKGIFKDFTFQGSGGPESLVIGDKAKVRGGTIDFGKDAAIDVVEIKSKAGLKDVDMKNFGAEDKILYKGQDISGILKKGDSVDGIGGITFS
jgi:hypothetical protein